MATALDDKGFALRREDDVCTVGQVIEIVSLGYVLCKMEMADGSFAQQLLILDDFSDNSSVFFDTHEELTEWLDQKPPDGEGADVIPLRRRTIKDEAT